MKFVALSGNHTEQLLAFELENKSWFESFIEPRALGFYSEHGVSEHIRGHLQNMSLGLSYCGLLIDNDVIIGRGNITEICDGKASIGYRIDQKHISQGLATLCLSKLLELATDKFKSKTIEAQVLDNNPASRRVLEKHGFIAVDYAPDFLIHNNVKYGCTTYRNSYA